MNDELRSARERVRSGLYVSETKYWNDCVKLAHNDIAEHPADDDEPVMPEWLEFLGYADSTGGMRYEKRYEICNGIRIMFFARQHPQQWAAYIWCGTGKCPVRNNPTRGDVRRLLTALGIEVSK